MTSTSRVSPRPAPLAASCEQEVAPTRTREAIMQALVARRCYATSGAKIRLDVTADGAPMGSALDDRSSADFQIEVSGTQPVTSIELVGAEGVLARSEPHTHEASFSARVGSRFVYARITQTDGEMAWSSPIFLTK